MALGLGAFGVLERPLLPQGSRDLAPKTLGAFLYFGLVSARTGANRPLGFDVTARLTTLLEILLVVVFRGIKRDGGNDLRHDRLRIAVCPLETFLRCAGGSLLLGRMEIDGRTILRPPIRSLAVQLRGIMVLPESFQ